MGEGTKIGDGHSEKSSGDIVRTGNQTDLRTAQPETSFQWSCIDVGDAINNKAWIENIKCLLKAGVRWVMHKITIWRFLTLLKYVIMIDILRNFNMLNYCIHQKSLAGCFPLTFW